MTPRKHTPADTNRVRLGKPTSMRSKVKPATTNKQAVNADMGGSFKGGGSRSASVSRGASSAKTLNTYMLQVTTRAIAACISLRRRCDNERVAVATSASAQSAKERAVVTAMGVIFEANCPCR